MISNDDVFKWFTNHLMHILFPWLYDEPREKKEHIAGE